MPLHPQPLKKREQRALRHIPSIPGLPPCRKAPYTIRQSQLKYYSIINHSNDITYLPQDPTPQTLALQESTAQQWQARLTQ